ncbi:hypothetical protein [Mucilaginibacter sp. dw_454]|uniref:hypothetical protein n=1 Tax=Mucilaginibacter sp. dw_454 TaxID=2720079 RepID=UPI001BD50CB3|nr:hypothetical protein [Mucilaginibacter sp. dw_454]
MKKEKGIDDIFKHGLGEPADEPSFRESDWDNLDNMLDKERRGGRIFWLPILGSVAAVLLAFFGWWLFKPQAGNTVQNTQQVAINKTTKIQAAANAAQQQQIAATGQPRKSTAQNVKSANTTAIEKTTTQQTKVQPQYLAGISHADNANSNKQPVTGKKQLLNLPDLGSYKNVADTVRPYEVLAAVSSNAVIIDTARPTTPALADQPKTGINTLAVASPKQIKKPVMSSAFRPQYSVSVLAASEVNGVGSFQSTSAGTNIGLLFTAGVKKFSLSSGATYSTKPYSLPFSDYHTAYQFKNNPQYVTADCRVLDIPINVGYQLYNKSSNKITVATGISSYIMLHESYTYDYGNTSTLYGPSYYAVKGKGKYFFSIANLQASYERKVNSSMGLSLTPYLKLPLSDIGYSQVRVQTFGVAVGLNWNINSLTKPK